MSTIQRTAQDKMGFIQSGANLKFEGKVDLEVETGSPKGMVNVDAMDPQSHFKIKDLGSLKER